ncbi:MAG TPA: hypothetical protein VFU19_15090 [Iamia sp.]|nr:hypothetical protein [Iamia sp.]
MSVPQIGPTPQPVESTNCILHPFEPADRLCSQCGGWHCDGCLVMPWGPRKGALCVSCAIQRGGVRKTSGQSQMRTPAEIRKIERDRRKEQRDEDRRPIVVSPVGLQKLDVPDDPPKRRGLFRRK